jgi:hypothetical protein
MQFLYFTYTLLKCMESINIEQTIELLKQVQSNLPSPSPDEWVGFGLADDGKVIAGKNIRGNRQIYGQLINTFEPEDEWAKVADTLQVQQKFRQAFVNLSDEEMKFFKQKVREIMIPAGQ